MWHHISHIIQDILAKLTDVDTERMQKITHTLFAATIDYKCVTTMRLEDEAHITLILKLIIHYIEISGITFNLNVIPSLVKK